MASVSTIRSKLYQAEQGRILADEMKRSAAASAKAPPAAFAVVVPEVPKVESSGVLGRIEIKRIGISAIVKEGADDATLTLSVGHIPGTAGPGEIGNMALAGHRDSFFRGLRNIRLRDSIEFRTAGRCDRYRVESVMVVEPEAVQVLDPTSTRVLTLVTCYPFSWVGSAPKRFIVRASWVAN